MGSAPAYSFPFGEDGYPTKLRATLIHKITEMPGNYTLTAVFTPSTSYYNSSTRLSTNLPVIAREADLLNSTTGFYAGTILVWTTGTNSSTGTITMAATIKDSNIPTGDVRDAKVTFYYVNGSTLTPIPSAKNLPVNLINMTDGTVGVSSADVQVDIGKSTSVPFQIAVMITGGYINNLWDGESQALETVAKPVSAGSIFGSGNVADDCSNGLIRGAADQQTSFNFDITYNKKMTNPQGYMNVMVKSYYKKDGALDNVLHTYIIKNNAINLFVTN